MLVRLQGDSRQKSGFLLISALLPPNLAKISFNQVMAPLSHLFNTCLRIFGYLSNVFNELTLGRGMGEGG